MRRWLIVLANWLAVRNICRLGIFSIAPGSRIEGRKIRFKPECSLTVGEGSMIDAAIVYDRSGAKITIGNRTFVGSSDLISAERIDIGDDVLISWGCTIVDHNSHSTNWGERSRDVGDWIQGKKDWSSVRVKPVRICDKVWLGFNVIVLKGVTIGEGAVVAAGSVVTKDVSPHTMVAGNPARVVRGL